MLVFPKNAGKNASTIEKGLVSIYCVYKSIQNRNVVGLGQRSRFLVLTKRSADTGDENGSWVQVMTSCTCLSNVLC